MKITIVKTFLPDNMYTAWIEHHTLVVANDYSFRNI